MFAAQSFQLNVYQTQIALTVMGKPSNGVLIKFLRHFTIIPAIRNKSIHQVFHKQFLNNSESL